MRSLKIWVVAPIFLALSACATNPTSLWLSTCDSYYEVLRSVNDALEIGTISKDDNIVSTMKDAKFVLSPICTGEEPPEGVDRGNLQDTLDAILLELIKAEKGVSA